MPSSRYVGETPLAPNSVWDVLTDPEQMRRWTAARAVFIERPGTEATLGTGTIRAIRTWLGTYREEIVSYDPPSLLQYRVVSGLPVRDYLGRVKVDPIEGGTRITWSVNYEPATFLAPIIPFGTKLVLNGIFRRLLVQLGGRRMEPGGETI